MPAGSHCLVYNGTSGANGFGLFTNGASYEARIGSSSFGAAPATTTDWVHLAVVRSGGLATFYVNGVAAATSVAPMVTPSGQFGVAASPPAFTNDFFFGHVDEVRAFTFEPGAFAPTDLLLAHRVVYTTNDSGAGSLREAMTAAPAGTIIDIVVPGTLTLQGMLPFVTGALRINGPGAASFTIDGANLYRPFFIDAPASAITISGVTIAHGRAKGGNGGDGTFTGGGGLGAGGAMFVNRGDVTLSDVAFAGNQAIGGKGGNSIQNEGSSGGGGLGGDGGSTGFTSGSGGGGFLGNGGDSPAVSSAGGGGGVVGIGGSSGNGGGGGGGAWTAGQDGQASTGGAGAGGLGGNGGTYSAGADAASFSVVADPVAPVPLGGSTTFTVRFAPTIRGPKTASLRIASNDPDENPYDIALSGNGISPEIVVEQPLAADLPDGGSRNFGSVNLGAHASLDFTVRNSGDSELALGAASISGTNAADFAIMQQPASVVGAPMGSSNGSFETPLLGAGAFVASPAGAAWNFGARAGIARIGSPWFVNAPPSGAQAAYIQVLSNTAESYLDQPVTFANAGLYLIRFSYVRRGSGYGGTSIEVSIDDTVIGTVPLNLQNDDSWRTFVVPYTNPSPGATRTLRLFGNLVDGDRATAIDDVRIESTAVTKVRFLPRGTGIRTATLSIPNNDSDENPFDITLTGSGSGPGADLQVSKTNFGSNLYPGEDTAYTIQVVNAGPDSASNVRVADTPPAALIDGHWTCISTPGSLCPNASGTGSLEELTTQPLPSGALLQYSYFARVAGGASGFVTNTASVTSNDPAVPEVDAANNSATDTASIVGDGLFRNGFEPNQGDLLRPPL